MVGSEGTEAFEEQSGGGVPLGRASGPDHTGLNVGKESPHLGDWLSCQSQPVESWIRRELGGHVLATPTQARSPRTSQGDDAAPASSCVQWGLWRSSASSQGCTGCLGGPGMASCPSSCSGEA